MDLPWGLWTVIQTMSYGLGFTMITADIVLRCIAHAQRREVVTTESCIRCAWLLVVFFPTTYDVAAFWYDILLSVLLRICPGSLICRQAVVSLCRMFVLRPTPPVILGV